MTEYLDRMPTMHEYAEGKRINPKLTDLISRADAIEAKPEYRNEDMWDKEKSTYNKGWNDCNDAWVAIIKALPSAELTLQTPQTYGKSINPSNAEVVEDLISRADAVKTVIRKCSPICDWQDGTQQYPDCVVAEINALPSAEAVDCTDFVNWLTDAVMDEEYWELNAVAYGEIICRKLEKLGVLEATEEPSYYIRPSADAVQGWIPCSERLPSDDEIVNITWVNHNPPPYYTDIAEKPFVASGLRYCDKWYWYSSVCQDLHQDFDLIDKDIEVIAWQPLPKPYKGGDDK